MTTEPKLPLPVVGVSSCRRNPNPEPEEEFFVHWAAEKYLEAVVRGARAMPLMVPAFGRMGIRDDWIPELIERLDGLVLTGSRSNVEPHHYGEEAWEGDVSDPDRDATTLPLIRAAVAEGVPVLAICRGIQELNVALGGSLHPRVHELPGRLDHRSDKSVPLPDRFKPRHDIRIRAGGPLAGLAGGTEVTVNSLHGQAIDRPADDLIVEATAEDGTIEAVSLPGAKAFTVGVQWHAEWDFEQEPFYTAIVTAFGDAVHERAAGRKGGAAVMHAAE